MSDYLDDFKKDFLDKLSGEAREEMAWVESYPDYLCPNCGTPGVPQGVVCLCGCKGILPLRDSHTTK